MVQTLILTHGALAQALVDTAQHIVGDLRDVHCLALDWNEPRDTLLGRLSDVTARLDQGEGVLILTDLYGDTPSNLALGLIRPGHVEVVTGVNLAMVLRLCCLGARPMELGELARWIQEKGRQGIRVGTPTTADVVEEPVG
jgi:mannose/fructose-specific phosphotransferase system component IIA